MQMIEKLIGRAGWIKHYNAGPFLDERNQYLAYLQGIGQGSDRLRKIVSIRATTWLTAYALS